MSSDFGLRPTTRDDVKLAHEMYTALGVTLRRFPDEHNRPGSASCAASALVVLAGEIIQNIMDEDRAPAIEHYQQVLATVAQSKERV